MWGVQNDDDGEGMEDAAMRAVLERVRTIAVLGAKAGPHEDAYRVPLYLQQHGYRVLPVNPKLDALLGETAQPTLAELTQPVDLVDVFRAPQHVPAHTDEILALPSKPAAVWLQLGIRDDASAARLREAGIEVVQDRCIMVEHRRLLSSGTEPGG